MDIRPEEMWDRFIEHLNRIQPIGKPDKETGKCLPHKNFLGSVESYRKIFMEANESVTEGQQLDKEKVESITKRLAKMRGKILENGTKVTYFGDGINPGITSTELLEVLKT